MTPLQLYYSALVFTPEESIVRSTFQHFVTSWLVRIPSMGRIWSPCLQTLEGHSDWVSSVAFSPDSARLASASDNRTVKIWDASSGECLQTLEVGTELFEVLFDVTGSYLHTEISTFAIDACSASNINPSATDPQKPRYQGWALSPDGAWITYNSENEVWLPSEYRPSCSAVSRKTIGIGVGSGKVWICHFEADS